MSFRAIVAAIDTLIDEQLAAGEPETGYDYDDPEFPRCGHCDADWHGLPVTERMQEMRWLGEVDPGYRYADDDSPVICPGSTFIGPFATAEQIEYSRNPHPMPTYSLDELVRLRAARLPTWRELWDTGVPDLPEVPDPRWVQDEPVEEYDVEAWTSNPTTVPWARWHDEEPPGLVLALNEQDGRYLCAERRWPPSTRVITRTHQLHGLRWDGPVVTTEAFGDNPQAAEIRDVVSAISARRECRRNDG